ncbi:hypothetical protein [Flavihumibacter petaseus]|uniref:Uncharacterized protein n=1 Tax=Flavihumibacter petaseus NBRC 106054 TaxID=1220578 RepID=A0A0E9N4S0_9BACT|nr:hypothetical protein [Flavihumibacter petaseus]GAO44671.1 hypothetical protein FPE01S_03_07100 [Flavihumibacter petaseus NBRC 106054]
MVQRQLIYLCGEVHKIVAVILLFAFLGQTFNQGLYYAGYLVEKKEYMKRCVNKARPQLHCDGKCVLMKKLRDQEDRERGQSPELKLAAQQLIAQPRSFVTVPAIQVAETHAIYFTRIIGAPIDRATTLFHPPDLTC